MTTSEVSQLFGRLRFERDDRDPPDELHTLRGPGCSDLVVSLASGWVCASRALSADQQADTAVQDTLVQIEHQSTDAAVKEDVAAFSRCIADDWILTYSDGSLVTKAMALADLKEGALRIERRP